MEHIVCQIVFGMLLVVVLVIAILCLVVLAIMLIRKKSTQESVKILMNFFSSIYKALETPPAQAPLNYNIFIGYNGYCIRDDIVNEYFASLHNYWETVYYSDMKYVSQNVVEYEFRAYYPTKYEHSSRRLLASVKQVAEQALTRHFHNIGVSIPVDHFIAVKIYEDVVSVYIAVNEIGFQEIAALRKKIA